MSPLQIIFIGIAIFVFIKLLIALQKNKVTVLQFFFWTCFAILLGLSTYIIEWLNSFSEFIGVAKISDFFVYISIIVLFLYIYKLNIKIEQQNRDITKLVRQRAIKKK